MFSELHRLVNIQSQVWVYEQPVDGQSTKSMTKLGKESLLGHLFFTDSGSLVLKINGNWTPFHVIKFLLSLGDNVFTKLLILNSSNRKCRPLIFKIKLQSSFRKCTHTRLYKITIQIS